LAEVVDPSVHHGSDQVFFGATVTYVNAAGDEQTINIVGIDELDPQHGKISWVSPVARALTKAKEGDVITHINRQLVPSASEARTMAKASEQSVLLRLYRKGDTMLLMIGNQ
jgi:transcription elongation GreA/GreB family factor